MSDLQAVRGIIFDYGGTLDTGGDHWVWPLLEAYQAAGLALTFEQFRDAYVAGERALAASGAVSAGTTFHELLEIKVAVQLRLLGLSQALQAPIVEHCYGCARVSVRQAAEVLRALRPHYRLAVVSNFYGNLAAVLAEMGLADAVDAVVDSAIAGVRKPDPEIFRLGCWRLGLEPGQVLTVGDSERNDIVPSVSIGCRTVHVPGRQWPEGQHTATRADYEAKLSELPRILI